MKDLTLEQNIRDAIQEAMILETARDSFDRENVIYTAQRLSGAPYSFVKEIFSEMRGYKR